jgi:hypothetical protein
MTSCKYAIMTLENRLRALKGKNHEERIENHRRALARVEAEARSAETLLIKEQREHIKRALKILKGE